MAVTDNYDFWYLDPAEAMSDFPSMWNWNIDKIDAAIHGAATAPVSLSRLPNLPTSKVTSGRFADARIPTTVARTSETSALESRIAELESGPRSTGPRDISDQMDGLTGGKITITRVGDIVELSLSDAVFSESGNATEWVIPRGLCPASPYAVGNLSGAWGAIGTFATVYAFKSGGLWVSKEADKVVMGTVQWITDQSWPNNLPGTPA